LRFEDTLLEGTLVRRTRRFSADIKLRSGEHITAHCANPGSMIGCSEPGSRVLLSVKDSPRRRHRHQMEVIYAGRVAVGVHSGRPVSVVMEAIMQGKLSEVAGYATLKRQVAVPRVSCIDVTLAGNGLRTCQIVAKSATLAYEKVAYYPDAVRPNDLNDLIELTNIVREGNRAIIFLLAQRADVDYIRPADHIDPEYGQAFRDAVQRGVEVVSYRAKVTRKGIELDKKLPVDLGS
jgi:sugar fermentation stimulation protein A